MRTINFYNDGQEPLAQIIFVFSVFPFSCWYQHGQFPILSWIIFIDINKTFVNINTKLCWHQQKYPVITISDPVIVCLMIDFLYSFGWIKICSLYNCFCIGFWVIFLDTFDLVAYCVTLKTQTVMWIFESKTIFIVKFLFLDGIDVRSILDVGFVDRLRWMLVLSEIYIQMNIIISGFCI